MVGGDFNCVLNRADRRGAGEDFKVDRSSVLLQGLCRDFKLTDCFKTLHPREEGFTWTSGDGTRASRIDYLFTRDCPPTDARITPAFFSDHVMLTCTLSLTSGVTVGRGPWKLNCSLLEDDRVVSQYREQFSQWQTLQDFFDTRAQWWEMVKGRTRTFFREIGKKKSKEKDRRMVGLQKRLERYFNLGQQGFDFNYEIKEVKKEMALLAEQKSKGVILRSKERELEEGEKCTRYFFKKIVSKGRTMTGLKNKDGFLKTDTEGMKEVVEDFYGELFGEKVVCEETMGDVLTYIDKILPNTDDLTKDLTRTEIDQGLKHFKRGKSPGEDGLPLEFYLTFWDVLADELLTVFTDFEYLDRLPDSFRVGIVTLLYKKNDRTDLETDNPFKF